MQRNNFLTKVVQCMEKIAPLSLAEKSWDNVGLLLESPANSNRKLNKVFLTIDLTTQTLKEAIEQQTDVIIAYHPPIFKGLKRLTFDDVKQKIVIESISNNISIYSPHTAADNCLFGVNDWISDAFKNKMECFPINPANEVSEAQEGSGSGRIVKLKEKESFNSILNQVKTHFNLNNNITSIAICAGSGSSLLLGVDADIYLTGEMSHHDLLACVEAGKSVILGEHSNSERGYLSNYLKPKLEKELNSLNLDNVEVIVSKLDKDPVSIE
ncbi:NGG1p interacting factor 3 [Neoconidiobolus thromboides FSU 785]|nr:NGG1p interacting factor 3 [Neoconidiobolus thromboides FSU 785]